MFATRVQRYDPKGNDFPEEYEIAKHQLLQVCVIDEHSKNLTVVSQQWTVILTCRDRGATLRLGGGDD